MHKEVGLQSVKTTKKIEKTAKEEEYLDTQDNRIDQHEKAVGIIEQIKQGKIGGNTAMEPQEKTLTKKPGLP
jgi:hypothetical protein